MMHIIKLHITGGKTGTDTFFEYAEHYFSLLYRSGQITNEEWQYEPISGGVSVNLYCIEKDSYDDKNATKYALNHKNRLLNELGCHLEFQYVGVAPEFDLTMIPTQSEFFILRSLAFSPLVDGLTLDPIPLYKIPDTNPDGIGYDNIHFWENNYTRIEGLWHNGSISEKWMQTQLQHHKSDLNQQGIQCCQKIEEVTGTPTYYFLFSYRAWGQQKERARKCPHCGGDWLIEGATFNDFYGFKCDDCRLVSEISSNR